MDRLQNMDEPLPPDAIPYYSGKAYGFPFPFLSIGLEGWCDRQSTVEWHPGMFFLDITIFAIVGMIFYWLASRRKRTAIG